MTIHNRKLNVNLLLRYKLLLLRLIISLFSITKQIRLSNWQKIFVNANIINSNNKHTRPLEVQMWKNAWICAILNPKEACSQSKRINVTHSTLESMALLRKSMFSLSNILNWMTRLASTVCHSPVPRLLAAS